MKKLDSKKALELLIKDVINSKEDLEKNENRWVKHCIYVAIAAGRIAQKLNLDVDYAIALGYVHDIGRKISHPKHTITGYEYMIENGYQDEASVCLTHSFIDNNIYYTAGGPPQRKHIFDYVNNFLLSTDLTPYDNIVQMCDLFCSETGFTTIERRLLDITERKGVCDNSMLHFEKTMELKTRLEERMGCALYDLFPEIDTEVLEQEESDYSKLMDLINKNLIDTDIKLLKQ